jgi:PIN domain nuclease of toxin-antitoxin system
MKLLLDTHAIIWWLLNDPKLSARAIDAISDADNRVYVSAATGWEIGIKVRSGRMPEMADYAADFVEAVIAGGFEHLAVEARHGLIGGLMEGRHKDPFDRLIAAQALLEDMTLVTKDREMSQFGCKVLW